MRIPLTSVALVSGIVTLCIGMFVSLSSMSSVAQEALTIYLMDRTDGPPGDMVVVGEYDDEVRVAWVDQVIQDGTFVVLKDHNAEPLVPFVDMSDSNSGATDEPDHGPSDELVTCPLSGGDYLVDFTFGGSTMASDALIVANGSHGDSVKVEHLLVPPGKYKVKLASYASEDAPVFFEHGDTAAQQWRLGFFNNSLDDIAGTAPMPDVAPGEVLVETVEYGLEIVEDVYKVMAMHAAYPSSEPHPVVPLCAQMTFVEPLPGTIDDGSTDGADDNNTDATNEDTGSETVVTGTGTEDGPDTTESETTVDDENSTAGTTDTTDTTTDTTETTDSSTGSTDGPLYVSCPLPERENRTIVDFTQSGLQRVGELLLRADKDLSEAVITPRYVPLVSGMYEVRYASFRLAAVAETGREVWRAVLVNSDGITGIPVPPSRDIPAWEDEYVSRVDEPVAIGEPITHVGARHAAYPAVLRNHVAPLCVAFDLLEPFDDEGTVDDIVESVYEEPTVIREPEAAPVETSDTADDVLVHEVYISRETEDGERSVEVVSVDASGSVDTGVVVEEVDQKEEEPAYKDIVNRWIATVPIAETAPESVGLDSALREVVVPERTLTQRKTFIEQTSMTPRQALDRANDKEREALVEQLVKQADEATSTEISGKPRPRISLTRRVAEQPAEQSADTEVSVVEVPKRAGLASIRDMDGDGITDHDETYVYGTDPESPFTSGSVLSDGERVLLGLNPHTDDYEPVVAESPKVAPVTPTEKFTVETVEYVTIPIVNETIQKGTNATTSAIRVVGTAEPFMFVTLYLYSTPIVMTIQADAAGRYEYTFDRTLEDGKHEIFVTTVNNTGKIVAKSDPIPFVKTAEAIEYTPLAAASTADPATNTLQMMMTLMLLLLLVIGVLSIVWIGKHRSQEDAVVKEVDHAAEA